MCMRRCVCVHEYKRLYTAEIITMAYVCIKWLLIMQKVRNMLRKYTKKKKTKTKNQKIIEPLLFVMRMYSVLCACAPLHKKWKFL